MADLKDTVRIWVDHTVLGEPHKIGSELSATSGLPGGLDGPADAVRHLVRASLLYYRATDVGVDIMLAAREAIGGALFSRKEGMDGHNNALGKVIASRAKSEREVVSLALEVIEKTLAGHTKEDIAKWKPAKDGDGYLLAPNGELTLSNGLKISPITIYPPSKWHGRGGVTTDGSVQWPDKDGAWREGMLKQYDTMVAQSKANKPEPEDLSKVPLAPYSPRRKEPPFR